MTTTVTGNVCFAGGIHHRFSVSGCKVSVREGVVHGWFHFDIAALIENPRELGKDEVNVGQLRLGLTHPIMVQMWRDGVSVQASWSIQDGDIVLKGSDVPKVIVNEISMGPFSRVVC
jgi:hypothetical protein